MNSAYPRRVGYLDGIRAIAILAVIAVHWLNTYVGLGAGGYIGVDVFFVLSGFIITKTLWKSREERTYGEFLRGRVRRLYPALLGMVIPVSILASMLGVFSSSQVLSGAALALSQMNSIVSGLGLASTEPFPVTWSLSAEWFFYLLWPLAILLAPSLTRRRLLRLTLIAAVGCWAVSLTASPEWFYYGPVSRASQLLAGGAAALWVANPSKGSRALGMSMIRPALYLSLVFLATWIFAGPGAYSYEYRTIGFPLITLASIALVLGADLASTSLFVRALGCKPLAALGRSSYSLYLWHAVPLSLFDKDMLELPMPIIAAISVLVVAVGTILSYLLLEVPFQRSLRMNRQDHRQNPSGP